MQSDQKQVDVQVKTLGPKRLSKLISKDGYEPESLFKTWDTLSSWAEGQGIPQASQFRLAWCYDNPAVTPANKCRYEASIEINDSVNVTKPFQVIDSLLSITAVTPNDFGIFSTGNEKPIMNRYAIITSNTIENTTTTFFI